MAECSTPHGGETGRGDRQVYGGRGSLGAGGCGTLEEIKYMLDGMGRTEDVFLHLISNYTVVIV